MTRQNYMTLLSLMMILVLAGCSGMGEQKSRPDWIDGSSKRYSNTQYITGRGLADQLEAAQDRARANIAKTFEVSIHESSLDRTSAKSTGVGEARSLALESEIQRQIVSETDQIIAGIEISEIWQDPAQGQYHVLATLSRQQARTRLRQDITDLDQGTSRYINEARSQQDTLSRAGLAAKAWQLQEQRAALQAMLRIVDLSGQGMPSRWQTQQLRADFEQLLQRMRITPQATTQDQHSETVVTLLQHGLAQAGLIASQDENSDYVLQGELSLSDMGQRDGWYWSRGSFMMQLKDNQGQTRGSKRWENIKVAGPDAATSRQRLIEKLEQTVGKQMWSALIEMASP